MKYNPEDICKISIEDWMVKHGYKRGKRNTGKWRSFYSPFSKESNASFMIDTNVNKWMDYSAGITRKRSIIDLVMQIDNCNFKEACASLLGNKELRVEHFEPKKQESGVKIHSTNEITDKELLSYFNDVRKIGTCVLKKYCVQLNISFPFGQNPDKTYDVVAFKNDMGGYEMRSNFLKIANSPKCYTKFNGEDSDTVIILEGFMDWLSYVVLHGEPKCDTYVLNGLGMLNVVKPFLEDKHILFMLDNDTPANNALEELKDYNVTDMRGEYAFYKDYNEYLQSI